MTTCHQHGEPGAGRRLSTSHTAKRPALNVTFALVAGILGCGPRPATPPPRGGFLVGAGGARLHYEVAGSGHDTLIVVHGGPGAGINDIRPDLEPLATNHVVVYYDQRGGGRSDLPADTSLLDARYFVADLEAVRAHPDRVGRIVSLGATGPSRAGAAAFYGAQPVAADTVAARGRSLRTLAAPLLVVPDAAGPPTRAARSRPSSHRHVPVGALA